MRAGLSWPVALVACLALSACEGGARGQGKDGSLEPTGVGTCFGGPVGEDVVDCSDPHLAESVFVARSVPADHALAFKPCRAAARRYLGQEANTRLELRLWIAADHAWYRCDLFLRKSTQAKAGYESLTGSLKQILQKGVSPKLQSCLDEPFDPSRDQRYAPCTEQHVAEEIFFAPVVGVENEPYPADVGDRATTSCNAMAVADELLVGKRTVVAYFPRNEAAWASGQRTAMCWVAAAKGEKLPPVTSTSGG